MAHLIPGRSSAGYYRGKSNDHYVRNYAYEPWPFLTWVILWLSLSLSLLVHKGPHLTSLTGSAWEFSEEIQPSHTAGGSVTGATILQHDLSGIKNAHALPTLNPSPSKVHTPRKLSWVHKEPTWAHSSQDCLWWQKWELWQHLLLEEYVSKMCPVYNEIWHSHQRY